MAKKRKENKKEKNEQQRKQMLEDQKLEQDIRFAENDEKRKQAKELRELEDQEIKRKEELRKQSADMREELGLWLKCMLGVSVGLLTLVRFQSLFTTMFGNVVFYFLVGLHALLAAVFTTRIAVKSVKRLGKR